jgi:hypothetical protein
LRSAVFGSLFTTALIAATTPVIAADAGDEGSRCIERNFAASGAELRLGRAAGAGRTRLLGDGAGCPGPGAACRGSAFAEPGQVLLLGDSRPGYVCAFAAGRMPGNVGWIPVARLQPATQPIDPTPPLASWLGSWRQGDDTIALAAEGDRISAEGEAYWPARNIMPANEGAFAGAATPSGNRLRIVSHDCEVEMLLAGPFLVVTDNQMCGGHNVSFLGIYIRK